MLTNYDLEDICDSYNIKLNDICMKDDLPARLTDGNYIINLQSSIIGNGTHWLALNVKGKQCFFFDSFGAPPSIEIREFVKKRKGSHLAYNNWIIQDLKSENCGYFCVSFLLHIQKHFKQDLYEAANDYINKFQDDTSKNDNILKDTFRQMTKKGIPLLIKRLYNQK
jgi:hypothetical protein